MFEGQRQVGGQSGGRSGCSASPGSVFSAGWAARVRWVVGVGGTM